MLQIFPDWSLKLAAHGPDGLIDGKASDQASLLNTAHRAAWVAVFESDLIPAVQGAVRWRIIDL
ncbi:hypothetical protein HN018_21845 (plasmid) [Lichenicola cladoniae]|uniref:Uncharacterized protein n=1 Tax=Lichenicola cladoniae TaxID=1484109 RepID=A0A6M8HXE1_9PROT|nr:hypothetical protein [Lichenicola cladoniae]NPD68976.1 hypothetical protein [Acetobacteraceae bacterium]QKE92875.1 hypothetical protein HN018_21845 [Lichenicola cladoniae]